MKWAFPVGFVCNPNPSPSPQPNPNPNPNPSPSPDPNPKPRPNQVSESRVGSQGRALQRSQAAVKAFITAGVDEIEGVDQDKPVEALLFVSGGQDFAGAGSKKGMQVSGAQVSFSLMQDGKELEVKGLTANPIQLTVPVADPNPNPNPNPSPSPFPNPSPVP